MTTDEHVHEVQGAPHEHQVPESEPKTIRLTLEAGERVDPHRRPDRETAPTAIDGAIEPQLGPESREVETGDVPRFEGGRSVSPRATEGRCRVVRAGSSVSVTSPSTRFVGTGAPGIGASVERTRATVRSFEDGDLER